MTERAKRGFLMERRAGGQDQELKSGLPFKDGGNRQEAEMSLMLLATCPLAGVESCPEWNPHTDTGSCPHLAWLLCWLSGGRRETQDRMEGGRWSLPRLRPPERFLQPHEAPLRSRTCHFWSQGLLSTSCSSTLRFPPPHPHHCQPVQLLCQNGH